MKTSISHLPEIKQREIFQILEIIKQEATPEKVILFGSHATETWVEDEYKEDGVKFSYISDYDFLVVINDDGKREQAIINAIENRTNDFKNSVSVIVHRVDYINEGLSIGQYFFTDIINKGISLFDSGKSSFVNVKELTLEEKAIKAQNYFDLWFNKGSKYLKGARFYFEEGDLSECIFLLHQSAEYFYSVVLLVFLGYKPKTHNLQKLRNYSKHISSELYTIFKVPLPGGIDYHLFELLKRGYIDARYKPDYNIRENEIEKLIDRITKMQGVVKDLCETEISNIS